MKWLFVFFIVVIWGLTTPTLLAQDSLVRIKPSTARFFLEQHDRAVTLTKKDSLNTKLIFNLETEIQFKDKIINSYQEDSILYSEERQLNEDLLRIKNDQIRAQKKVTRLTKLGAIIVVVLILVIK
jgi:hypothetical protein